MLFDTKVCHFLKSDASLIQSVNYITSYGSVDKIEMLCTMMPVFMVNEGACRLGL